jgi:hypothetical protein
MRNVRAAYPFEKHKKMRLWLGTTTCPTCSKAFDDRIYCTKAKALAFEGMCPTCEAALDAQIERLMSQRTEVS